MSGISLFILGGTILSIAGKASPADSASLLRQAGIDPVGPISVNRWRNVGSQNLRITDLVALATEIERQAAAGTQGFIVVQGTDTMEETGFLLSLLLPADIPLVLTGAMRTADAPGADGPGNLNDAILTVRALCGLALGPIICMNGELHGVRHVRKVDAGRIGAFASPGIGPLGTVVTGRVRLLQRPLPQPGPYPLPEPADLPRVALVSVGLDSDPLLIEAFADRQWQGLVVEGVGSGHVPQPLAAPLIRLAGERPVILVSRCGGGDTDAEGTYQGKGTASHLIANGLIDGGPLQGRKARLLLTILLAQAADPASVRAALAPWAALGLLAG
ncbi:MULTISPECIES: asparaginase [unclassified Azospirillum]|uniref:asparaginase n=1 Tax=unclassified Azospirillum TaxID=2630922 RepID=UPI000B719C00|nr:MULTISPECIES: asparaginase [unclassified Azospirillum]SNS18334.1 L-asparaginase [Azospirillum sp. RU38E]SNS35886.1 L-asparaginase [Azospirillum sp. RU37A]